MRDRALLSIARGNVDTARKLAWDAIQTHDKDFQAWLVYAIILAHIEGISDAVEQAFERAKDLAPLRFETWALLSAHFMAVYKQKENQAVSNIDDAKLKETKRKAYDAFEKAVNLAPKGLNVSLWMQKHYKPVLWRKSEE